MEMQNIHPVVGGPHDPQGFPQGAGFAGVPQPVDPNRYICSLSRRMMTDPVQCPDGHIYDRESILNALSIHPVCPIDSRPLTQDKLIPNPQLKAEIAAFKPAQVIVTPAGNSGAPAVAVRGGGRRRDPLGYSGPKRSCCPSCGCKCPAIGELNPATQIGVIAGVTAIGIGLLLLGCGLYKEWLPMVCLAPFVLTMPPVWLCNLWKSSNLDILFSEPNEKVGTHIGQFMVGVFSVSSVAVLLVLLHGGLIVWQAVVLCCAACVVFGIAGVLLLKSLEKEDDNIF